MLRQGHIWAGKRHGRLCICTPQLDDQQVRAVARHKCCLPPRREEVCPDWPLQLWGGMVVFFDGNTRLRVKKVVYPNSPVFLLPPLALHVQKMIVGRRRWALERIWLNAHRPPHNTNPATTAAASGLTTGWPRTAATPTPLPRAWHAPTRCSRRTLRYARTYRLACLQVDTCLAGMRHGSSEATTLSTGNCILNTRVHHSFSFKVYSVLQRSFSRYVEISVSHKETRAVQQPE